VTIALDAYQRRQQLKSHEYLNGEVGAADRKRMVAVMNAHGNPRGSEVTVERVMVEVVADYELCRRECYTFTTDCPVVAQMLGEKFDCTDMLRCESAIRLMETYGVVVNRRGC
jgi:hypothetical protein